MPTLAYAVDAYQRSDLPELRVLNQYVEATPAILGAPAVLLARPALTLFSEAGAGPIRGIFSAPNVLNGDIFTVSQSQLYRGSVLLGAIPESARVSMAATRDNIMISNDAGMFTTDGVTLTATEFPDRAGVSSVGYLAGYAFAVRAGSHIIYFSMDPTTWDGLDFVSAEQDTGEIVGTAVVADQIWVFGQRVTEIFSPTGNADAPFQRVEGRIYDKGCLSRDTIARADNSVTWVGSDRIVYRGDNAPVRISNHGIEERLKNSVAEDLRAWSFPWNGHIFYALRLASGTFVYDYATQQWSEFASHGREAWRAHIGVLRDGVILAGDDTDGKIWRLTDDVLTDDGAPIERRFTAILKESPVIIDNITMDCSVGQSADYGADAIIEVRISRDGGNTWGAWKPATMGARGNYRARPVWRRMGIADGKAVFEFRLTDDTRWRLSTVAANDSLAGRSR
jgi:hypothetical protein